MPEAVCYPRPLQERIPILVGGSGERRTLRLVARHADACNLFGDPDEVRHNVGVLHRHCEEVGRDPAGVTVTQLGEAAVIDAGAERRSPVAGTLEEQVGRAASWRTPGCKAFVALHEVVDAQGSTAAVERFAAVIEAFA